MLFWAENCPKFEDEKLSENCFWPKRSFVKSIPVADGSLAAAIALIDVLAALDLGVNVIITIFGDLGQFFCENGRIFLKTNTNYGQIYVCIGKWLCLY
jgi:hypothetical protein